MDSLAVIGYAVRYPQEATDSVRFWDFLLKARESSTAFPEDRVNQKAFYHPDPDHGGTIHAKRAHFLKDNPVGFDAAFFKMSKTEVLSLDPQHRLVMENVYHALENAGIPMENAISSNTSVFVNGYNHDHADNLNTDPETILKYKPTGTENSMISGRLSWFYDFRGPSLTVETACSGSLVGLHLACQSLKTDESDMAIVSGVNVIGFLPHMVGMDYSGFMGSEGKCFAFDHRADGYSRGEGVGTVIVKRLSSAVEDGDTIRAVIRGTGLNQDGHTPGITYPSLNSQQRLIERTYHNAGLDTADTCYIETHGTGTQAGDYVEASAISSGFKTTTRALPLYLGALKTNIGHLEGGSGIAGLIKTIMILETGVIPPNANFKKPNPKIPVNEWKLSLPTRCEAWPTSKLRRASVSCFGLSGTNSHCILDDAYNFLRTHRISAKHRTRISAPTQEEIQSLQQEIDDINMMTNTGDDGPPGSDTFSPKSLMPIGLSQERIPPIEDSQASTALFMLSGFDESSFNKVILDLAEYIHMKGRLSLEEESKFLGDLSFTLSQRRTRFTWNACLLANSISQLQNRLANDSLVPQHSRVPPRLGFVFTGQGAQYAGMGRQLLAYPVFYRSIEAAGRYFQSLGGEWSLLEELGRDKDSTRINEPAIAHPSSTAIQIALVELLASWGIFPTRVVGHSSGEIAAAYCAGKISRQAAWKVAFFRGQVVYGSVTRPGSMMAVGLSPDDLQPYLEEVQKSDPDGVLTIACFNSPKNQTVSGDSAMVDALKSLLDAKRIFARKLNLGKAYHSEHMKVFTESYQVFMGSLEKGNTVPREQPVTLFSTFTGDILLDPSLDSTYWCSNMVSPVKFEQALRAMCYSPSEKQTLPNDEHENPLQVDELIEIGAHGALRSAITETIDVEQGITYHPTLDRNASGPDGVLQTVANLVSKGCPVDIPSVNNAEVQDTDVDLLVDLPPYPFNHENKDIHESRLARNLRLRQYPRHDIFGAPVTDWNPHYPKWRHFLRLSENPWLRQYKLDGQYVVPPAGYIAMAIESSMQIHSSEMTMKGLHLERLAMGPLLFLSDESQGVELSLSHYPVGDGSGLTRFQVSSYNESQDSWTEHCSGFFIIDYSDDDGPIDPSLVDSHTKAGLKEGLSYQRNGCQTPIKLEDMCRGLSYSGMELGPLFQNLSSIRVSGQGDGKCIGTIQVPDVSSVMPKNYMHPHLLHPVTLNDFGIAATAAIHDLQPDNAEMKVFLPSFIERVWVSTEAPYDMGTKFHFVGTASATGRDKYSCIIEASIDSSSSEPRISFSGAHFDLYESESRSSNTKTLPRFYSVEWKPDIHLLADSFFDQPTEPPTTESAKYEQECQWFTDLQLASALLSTDALLGLKGVDLTQLEPHYLRFYDLLKHIAADILTDSMPRVPFKTWQKYAQDPNLKEQLYRKVEARDSDGALLIRVGSNLASFFRREIDPLHVMFGQDDLMSQYYKDDFEIGSIPEKLKRYLNLFRWNKSNLRVLEVGGGTGSFTAHALAHLCPPGLDRPVAEYVFTDLSPSFFAKAKESLNEWDDVMTYKKFDVGSDPISQGFDPGTFDLIVASNVLHATPDLHETLKNIHCLLKPGGKLAFHEGVRQDTSWTNLSFSPLSGWWLSTEPERRWCPYVPTSTWDRYLRESGFSGLELEFPSSEYPEFSKISLMVSTAIEVNDISANHTDGIITIADGESSTLARAFQSQLEHLGSHCSIHTLAELEAVDVLDRPCVVFMASDPPIPTGASIETYNRLENTLSKSNNILFVTGDSAKNPAFDIPIGLIRNKRFQQDSDDSNIVTVSLTDTEGTKDTTSKSLVRIFKHQFLPPTVPTIRNAEYRLEQGTILTKRVTLNADANFTIGGRLSTPQSVPLTWTEINRPIKLIGHGHLVWEADDLLDNLLGENDVDLDVQAVGLSARDVLTATGKLPQMTLGEEASGVVTKVGSSVKNLQPGDRVMCISDSQAGREGTLRTAMRTDSSLVIGIPDHLSFEAAAALPVSWLTAIYSISYVGRLVGGENILIHAAASSLGQAAIQYSQSLGANVFVTVSNVDEKDYITREYGVQPDRIFSSRPTIFPDQFKRQVPGGMDVIISGLSAETTRVSLDCMAPFGRLIDISNSGSHSVHNISASCNADNVTISKVNLNSIARSRPKTIQNIFGEMTQLMEEHKIRPQPPSRVLTYGQMHQGIEMLQKDKHAGKIVLRPSQDVVQVVPEISSPAQLEHNASYLLIGALDSFHYKLALHMAARGAKNLILLSRAPGLEIEDTQRQILDTLREQGCEAHTYHCNMEESELQSLIARWRNQVPHIKGIIESIYRTGASNGSVGTQSTSLSNQLIMELLNVHNAIPDVDFFLMISSMSGLTGNENDGDSSATGTFQDALVRHRISQGLHAASINVGGMKDEEVLGAVDYMTDHHNPPTLDSCQMVCNLPTPASFQEAGVPVPRYLCSPLFHQLPSFRSRVATIPTESARRPSVSDLLNKTDNAEQAAAVVSGEIRRKLSNLLNVTEDEINEMHDVRTNGVDSLIEMEFRNWLDRELSTAVSLEDLTSKSISKLSAYVVTASPLVSFT